MPSPQLLSVLVSAILAATTAPAWATSKQTSLDEPFQSSFLHLPHAPCVTLYHRNGRIGCGTANRDGQMGPLYYYNGSSGAPSGSRYVAVIEEFALNANIIDSLLQTKEYLQGILVLNSTDSSSDDDYYSPGAKCPLGYGTPSAALTYGYNQYAWNAKGTGINQYDFFGVPMAYVNEYETSNYLREVSQDSSRAAKVVAQFNYYMGPGNTDSKKCLAWQDANDGKWNPKCLPLGGTSVWGFAGSPPPVKDNNNGNAARPSIVVGTSIDTTSLFHDLAPGANTAASNTLTLIMAAYLLGQNVDDAVLDALPNQIIFGFFQGEAYGYIGSRNFIRDVNNFQCNNKVQSVSDNPNSEAACLYPLRSSLKFMDIGVIQGMLTVDQVGLPMSDGLLYVHNDGKGGTGTFLANVLKATKTQYYSVAGSSTGSYNDYYPYPPTPLTALQSITDGAYGGAVLAGYDLAYTKRPPYQSHLNWAKNIDMNMKSISSAATILARAALAAAYDDGSNDYNTAAAYAKNAIPALSYQDEVLLDLANCLFVDGGCDMLRKYAEMEAKNEKDRTGFNVGSGATIGKPPNFYASIYNMYYGQPFVQVGDKVYGAYDGDKYGQKKTDAVGTQPRRLEQALRNMLHDFLGRGSVGDGESLQACKKRSDCAGVGYCDAEGDSATCSAQNVCVCTRAYFHPALDEALVPALNKQPGFFQVDENDAGNSPIYAEPFWSNDVGVHLYRDAKTKPGIVTLVSGLVMLAVCFFSTVLLKVGLKKEKLY